MLGNICKARLNSLAFWGEVERLAVCQPVLLLVRLGHPYPRKTCELERCPRTCLLCVVAEQRGLQTKGIANSVLGSFSFRNHHVDTDACLEARLRWSSETLFRYVPFFRRARPC